jgi:hypothetical protein
MASYPGSVPVKPTIVTTDMSQATTHATDRGLLWDEVRAIAIELGLTPSGSSGTVKERLDTFNDAVCQVSTSTGNTLTSGSSAVIAWESEVLDPLGWHAAGAQTIVPTVAGYYRVGVRGSVGADPDSDYTLLQIVVQKNGVDTHILSVAPSQAASQTASLFGVTPLIQMNGTTDSLRIRAAQINTDADARTFTGFFDVELRYQS